MKKLLAVVIGVLFTFVAGLTVYNHTHKTTTTPTQTSTDGQSNTLHAAGSVNLSIQ